MQTFLSHYISMKKIQVVATIITSSESILAHQYKIYEKWYSLDYERVAKSQQIVGQFTVNKKSLWNLNYATIPEKEFLKDSDEFTKENLKFRKKFIFRFDEEISIGKFNIADLIKHYQLFNPSYQKGAPIYVKGEELLKFKI